MQLSVIIPFVYYDLLLFLNGCETIFAAELRPVCIRTVIHK